MHMRNFGAKFIFTSCLCLAACLTNALTDDTNLGQIFGWTPDLYPDDLPFSDGQFVSSINLANVISLHACDMSANASRTQTVQPSWFCLKIIIRYHTWVPLAATIWVYCKTLSPWCEWLGNARQAKPLGKLLLDSFWTVERVLTYNFYFFFTFSYSQLNYL